ncbi:MAG: sarcosine oxidase [Rhodothermales bacterium]|jgi:sarcosine oxidase
MTKDKADVLVIGAGLMGSAAARHCADAGASVILIGPDEPPDLRNHTGVFASHYDEGRITRTLDRSAVWGELARRSMERYAALEDRTGIDFHESRGFLRVDPPGSPAPDDVGKVEKELKASYQTLSPGELKAQLPDFDFPEGYTGMLERGLAGVINPRRLLEAQHEALRLAGGRVIRHVVHRLDRDGGAFAVRVPEGTIRAERLIVATGAVTGLRPLTPERVPLRVAVETVWLARVTEGEAARMTASPPLPGLWYEMDWHATIPHIYFLPPIRYPDGHWYLKIGGDADPGVPLENMEDVRRFFAAGGTATRAVELREIIHRLLPRLSLDQGMAMPCILCYTAHGRPYIHQFPDGTVVAAGGNGSAAKSSDEIGRLAARRSLGLESDPTLPDALFEIR